MNKITVLTSSKGFNLNIKVYKGHKLVISYGYNSIRSFRSGLTNIVANLKQAGYNVTYNEYLI